MVALVCITGCVSTPAKRIARNPELFASFPPEVQEKVKRGEIALGFDREMVRLALGNPYRRCERQTENKVVEVWSYVRPCLRWSTDFLPVEYWYIDHRGRLRIRYDWAWVRTERPCEQEVLRVEFADGKVSSIERLQTH